MFRTVLTILVFLSGFPVFAVIDLTPKTIEVGVDDTEKMTIVNKSDHEEYVAVTLSKLINPGVPYEQEILEPVGMASSPKLYAYPFKLTLARGQSKTIHLKPLSAVIQETVYRLDVKPATEISGNGLLNPVAGVAVNLSFSALVRQLPKKKTTEIATSCTTQGVTLTATGTVRYAVKELKVEGTLMDEFNVYPGTPIVIAGDNIEIKGKKVCG